MTASAPPAAVAGAAMVSWSQIILPSFDAEPLSDAEFVGALDVVPAHELRRGHPVAAGDGAQRVALFDGIDCSGTFLTLLVEVRRVDVFLEVQRVFGQNSRLVGDVLRQAALRKHQRVRLGRGRDDVEFILRVELAQGFDRHVDCRGDLLEVHDPVDADGVGGQRNRGFGEFDAVLAVVGVGIRRTDEGGDVAARFAGQVVVDVPEGAALLACAGQRLIDVARTAVVGGDGQRPVFVDGVKVFEVTAGGLRRTDRVAAFVDQRIDLKSVAFARRGHELPQSYGAHGRYGRDGERRFDDRQGPQLDGKPLFEQLVLDQREIVLRHAQNPADRAVAGVGVTVDVAPDDAVVGELDGRCEVAQTPGIDRVGNSAGLCAVHQNIVVEELPERVAALPFAPYGDQRIGLRGRQSQRHVVIRERCGCRRGRFGFALGVCGLCGRRSGGRCGFGDGFGPGFFLLFLAGFAVEARCGRSDGHQQHYGQEDSHRLEFETQVEPEYRTVAAGGGNVCIIDQRFEIHRQVVGDVVVFQVGVHMGVHDLKDVQSGRDDDAEVAVAAVVVAQVADEVRRVAAVEFVGRAVGVGVRILFVVAQQPVCLFETLVAAVVPVDTVDHRGETAHDEGHFPIAFVVNLSRAGEDAGQRGGFLDVRDLVGRVVHGGVADEIDVRGHRKAQIDLPAGVAADHPALQRVQFGRAREVFVRVGFVFALEGLVSLVFVEIEGQTRTQGAVENGQFPVLFVVNLSVTGQYGRNPAHLRERHRIAHQPAAFMLGGVRFDLYAGHFEPVERVGFAYVVGAQLRDGGRVGREESRHQRIQFADQREVGQRVGFRGERIPLHEHAPAHDGARPAVELRLGGKPQRECREYRQQVSEPDTSHII